MKYLYLVESNEELERYRRFVERHKDTLDGFVRYLTAQFDGVELPNAVVLTSEDTATKQISAIPLPGYTNDFRTVFCPDVGVWRRIYLRQLDSLDDSDIRGYYETELNEDHVLQILGHEFVHHCSLFIDEAYDASRWFEEGMCEYISRKYFLAEEEFAREVRINALLVNRYENLHGKQPPERFTRDLYNGTIEDIFYFYWKSFLTVDAAVKQTGDVKEVFREYHRWFREDPAAPLSARFGLNAC